jgi:hypothetical protein
VFQPDKMVMQTYVQVQLTRVQCTVPHQEDRPRGNKSGLYEFFRGRAWVAGHALLGLAKVNTHRMLLRLILLMGWHYSSNMSCFVVSNMYFIQF